MKRTSMIVAALGLLTAGIGPALADQMPPGMSDMPAPKQQVKPKAKPNHPVRHRQRSARTQRAPAAAPHPSPSPSPSAMPMKSGGCC